MAGAGTPVLPELSMIVQLLACLACYGQSILEEVAPIGMYAWQPSASCRTCAGTGCEGSPYKRFCAVVQAWASFQSSPCSITAARQTPCTP